MESHYPSNVADDDLEAVHFLGQFGNMLDRVQHVALRWDVWICELRTVPETSIDDKYTSNHTGHQHIIFIITQLQAEILITYPLFRNIRQQNEQFGEKRLKCLQVH